MVDPFSFEDRNTDAQTMAFWFNCAFTRVFFNITRALKWDCFWKKTDGFTFSSEVDRKCQVLLPLTAWLLSKARKNCKKLLLESMSLIKARACFAVIIKNIYICMGLYQS